MMEYISEQSLYILWIIGAGGIISIAYAIFAWSNFIGDVRRKSLIALAIISGVWGIASVICGVVGLACDDSLGILTLIRLSGNTILPVAVGVILNWIVWTSNRLEPAEKDLVRSAARAFATLGTALHNSN